MPKIPTEWFARYHWPLPQEGEAVVVFIFYNIVHRTKNRNEINCFFFNAFSLSIFFYGRSMVCYLNSQPAFPILPSTLYLQHLGTQLLSFILEVELRFIVHMFNLS